METASTYNISLNVLAKDILAGISIVPVILAQGIAYGVLAGLQPIHGLFTFTLPVLFYSIIGSGNWTFIGPFVLTSSMIGQTLKQTRVESSDISQRLECVSTMSFLCGLMLIGIGMCRIGPVLKKYALSNAMIDGFTCSCCFHILASQVKWISGMRFVEFEVVSVPLTFFYTIVGVGMDVKMNWIAFLIFVSTLLCLCGLSFVQGKLRDKFNGCMVPPSVFLVLVFALCISWQFELNRFVNVVGVLPQGLPLFSLPTFNYITFKLVFDCVLISIITYVVTAAVGDTFETISHTRTLFALGACSLISSVCSCLIPGAGLARSALLKDLGGQTRVATCVASLCVLGIVCVGSGVLQTLPMSVLAALICKTAVQLLMKTKVASFGKCDRVVWIVTFLSIFVLNISYGTVIGMTCNFLLYLYKRREEKNVIEKV